MTESLKVHLDRARKVLLDLTARNRLVNTPRHKSRGKALEIVDELGDEIFRILVRDGKRMSFLPVAEPDLEEDDADSEPDDDWFGQPDDDDEVDERGLPLRHTDTKLQTKLTDTKLQRKLLSLFYDARTAEEEQGVNILYLALGFLKWFEDPKSEKARYAPLILIPCVLERKDANKKFKLSYSDEELSTNLSLQQRIKMDFGLKLPEIEAIEDFSPSEYFKKVKQAVSTKERWEVLSDEIVLGFYSFSKLLMYRDLDLDNWPEQNQADHPVLAALLDKGFDEPASEAEDEANPDPVLASKDIHHVVDADGSQVLALLDVNQGRNLVVQGPPGTGKSQTITNMIAETLGAGKTVLFVSEKMAALDVVKRRLDAVGLGDACLELHSNKTAKKAVLEELSRTISLGRPLLGSIDADSDELMRLRERLNAYSDALRVPVGESGVNPYRVLGELIRLRQESDGVLLPKLDLSGIQSWTGTDYRHRHGVVEELQGRVAAMGVPQDHVFWGSRRTSVFPTELDRLRQDLNQ